MTPTSIKSAFENYKAESIDSTKFYRWLNNVVRFIRKYIKKCDPWKLINSATTFTLVTNTNNVFTLPTGFGSVNFADCGFFELDIDGNPIEWNGKARPLPVTSYGSTSKGYYLKSSQVVFTGFSTTAVTIQLHHIPLYTDITTSDAATAIIIPDEYKTLIEQGLNVEYAIDDENVLDEDEADRRFGGLITEFEQDFVREQQVIQIPSTHYNF